MPEKVLYQTSCNPDITLFCIALYNKGVTVKLYSKAVTIKLWWSEIPTSETSEFLKKKLYNKIKSMHLGLVDWMQIAFQIKCIHKNFKIFVLNSKVEIPNQHNIFLFTRHFSQSKSQIFKEILIILWKGLVETNTEQLPIFNR